MPDMRRTHRRRTEDHIETEPAKDVGAGSELGHAQAPTVSATLRTDGFSADLLSDGGAVRGPLDGSHARPVPAVDNGLPAPMRQRFERVSGVSLGDVRVRYGSAVPAKFGAHALAEDREIHIGPSGAKHLAHEAWHMVQKRQGRVAPTGVIAGVAINDDPALEREADRMGAANGGGAAMAPLIAMAAPRPFASASGAVQLKAFIDDQPVTDADLIGDLTDAERDRLRAMMADDIDNAGRRFRTAEELRHYLTAAGAASPVPTSPVSSRKRAREHESVAAEQPGRWLLSIRPRSEGGSAYFWEAGRDAAPPTEDPSIWSSQFEKLKSPPGNYYTLDRRAKRGKGAYEALTLDQYRARTKGTRATAASDHYNPFGRFASANMTSFIPAHELSSDARTLIVKELAAKDASFVDAAELTPSDDRTELHHPKTLTAKDGTVLNIVAQSPLGTHYADAAPKANTRAQASGAVTAPLALQGTEVAHKIVGPITISKQTLNDWSHESRSVSQKEVMGASAGQVAASAGFPEKEGKGWEWLHLVAHGMGGPGATNGGPQVAENLVAGTHEANSEMIVAEEFLKDIVLRTGGEIKLFVAATMLDPVRHIGETITYDAVLYGADKSPVAVYHWTFDCLTRDRPEASHNRQARYVGRAVVGKLGEEGDAGFGASGLKPQVSAAEPSTTVPELIQTEWRRLLDNPGDLFDAIADIGANSPPDVDAIMDVLRWIPKNAPHDVLVLPTQAAFLRGVVQYHPIPDFLTEMMGRIADFAGRESKVPDWAMRPFFVAERFLGMAGQAHSPLAAHSSDAANRIRLETERRGNCLYEAVNIMLGNPAEMDAGLRELTTDYFLEHPSLADDAGLTVDEVVHILSTPGEWGGDAGDLAPVVLAAVIRRNIVIVTDAATYHVETPEPVVGDPIRLFLHNGHYTVNPVTPGQQESDERAPVPMRLPEANRG